MISPSKQKIIQIEITNACPHECSNCTRFCGHHKKPFFMSIPDFKKAVYSLKAFPGMVGVMGGEPTLHPKFEKLIEYYNREIPKDPLPEKRKSFFRDFVKYRNDNLSGIHKKRGIWSSLGNGYYKHFETIQDTFGYQCINDHTNNGEHMALLVSRKELGISDKDWVKYRDNCWLQREWSGSITPKGAFFCEVAAALDMLFDGPGGWPVEPGWWKREPHEFGNQLDWCEMCSACLPVPHKKANEGVDILSPDIYTRLELMGSRKVKNGLVEVIDTKRYNPDNFKVNQECEPYLPSEGAKARISDTNYTIRPRKVEAVIVCVGYDDYLKETLYFNHKEVDRIVVVTDEFDEDTPKVCEEYSNVECIVSKRIHEGGAKFAKGKGINDALDYLGNNKDWILHLDADIILPVGFRKTIKDLVLNPGTLYYARRWGVETIDKIPKFLRDLRNPKADRVALYSKYASSEVAKVEGRKGNAVEYLPFGYFQLFNAKASSLKGRKKIYPESSKSAENDDKEFGFRVFPEHKRHALPVREFDVIHIPHGYWQENWEGRRSPRIEVIKREPSKYSSPTATYVCKTTCYYQNRKYEVGNKLTSDRWDVPKHFRRL